VLETFQQLFYSWIDKDALCDPGKMWLLKGVNASKPKSMESLPLILDDYCTVLERTKLYSTDSIALLEAATFRTVKLIKSW
jgi:hypothetical protein